MSKIFKFGDFCRLCLAQSKCMIHIDTDDTDKVKIIDKIKFINKDLISENDSLPKWICDSCKSKLNVTYNFQKRCVQSRNILNQCLSQIQHSFFGQNDVKLYITNIKTVQNTEVQEDPLRITNEEMPVSNIPEIRIKTEPVEEENNGDVKTVKTVDISSITNNQEIEIKEEPIEDESEVKTHIIKKRVPLILKSPKPINEFPCKTCLKILPNEKSFIEHMKTHRSLYFCAVCTKSFNFKHNLSKHLSTHLREEDFFTCKYCNKKYKQVSMLKQHLIVHEREKKMALNVKKPDDVYNCSVCNIKFDRKHLLTVHMRTHFDNKS